MLAGAPLPTPAVDVLDAFGNVCEDFIGKATLSARRVAAAKPPNLVTARAPPPRKAGPQELTLSLRKGRVAVEDAKACAEARQGASFLSGAAGDYRWFAEVAPATPGQAALRASSDAFKVKCSYAAEYAVFTEGPSSRAAAAAGVAPVDRAGNVVEAHAPARVHVEVDKLGERLLADLKRERDKGALSSPRKEALLVWETVFDAARGATFADAPASVFERAGSYVAKVDAPATDAPLPEAASGAAVSKEEAKKSAALAEVAAAAVNAAKKREKPPAKFLLGTKRQFPAVAAAKGPLGKEAAKHKGLDTVAASLDRERRRSLRGAGAYCVVARGKVWLAGGKASVDVCGASPLFDVVNGPPAKISFAPDASKAVFPPPDDRLLVAEELWTSVLPTFKVTDAAGHVVRASDAAPFTIYLTIMRCASENVSGDATRRVRRGAIAKLQEEQRLTRTWCPMLLGITAKTFKASPEGLAAFDASEELAAPLPGRYRLKASLMTRSGDMGEWAHVARCFSRPFDVVPPWTGSTTTSGPTTRRARRCRRRTRGSRACWFHATEEEVAHITETLAKIEKTEKEIAELTERKRVAEEKTRNLDRRSSGASRSRYKFILKKDLEEVKADLKKQKALAQERKKKLPFSKPPAKTKATRRTRLRPEEPLVDDPNLPGRPAAAYGACDKREALGGDRGAQASRAADAAADLEDEARCAARDGAYAAAVRGAGESRKAVVEAHDFLRASFIRQCRQCRDAKDDKKLKHSLQVNLGGYDHVKRLAAEALVSAAERVDAILGKHARATGRGRDHGGWARCAFDHIIADYVRAFNHKAAETRHFRKLPSGHAGWRRPGDGPAVHFDVLALYNGLRSETAAEHADHEHADRKRAKSFTARKPKRQTFADPRNCALLLRLRRFGCDFELSLGLHDVEPFRVDAREYDRLAGALTKDTCDAAPTFDDRGAADEPGGGRRELQETRKTTFTRTPVPSASGERAGQRWCVVYLCACLYFGAAASYGDTTAMRGGAAAAAPRALESPTAKEAAPVPENEDPRAQNKDLHAENEDLRGASAAEASLELALPRRTKLMGPAVTARVSRTTKSIMGPPMPVATTDTGTPPWVGVKVVKPGRS
ncbi:hypothetical protein JL720_11087 [Aureococcus anophagefferens]|nr:hypothetical protein JL720_11087 [Aureococcus anophagefferens]